MFRVHAKLFVTVKLGGSVQQQLVFDQPLVNIGRDPSNDLVIDNPAVSGNHLRVERRDAGYVIEDRGSTNGTFIDGKRIEREVILDGALVTVGKHTLELRVEGESERSEAYDSGGTILADGAEGTRLLDTDSHKALLREEAQRASGLRSATLTLEKGKAEPREVELTGDATLIGKDDGVAMRLKGLTLPRGFFSVERDGDGYYLNPWGLSGKVGLNGQPVTRRTKIGSNTLITLGGAALRFRLG